jgi:hypothetical protein
MMVNTRDGTIKLMHIKLNLGEKSDVQALTDNFKDMRTKAIQHI